MTLAPGTRLGPYEILSPLGAGGMGEVYRAHDAKLNRDVAIKILPHALASDQAARSRFEREAQAVAALSHPNILGIFDFGVDGATPFAVMELLDGGTLRDALQDGAIPPRKTLEYARQIATGLGAAHAQGITHRDLKPENLFLTRDGRIKILDFGLAKVNSAAAASRPSMMETAPALTGAGTIVGTVGYMSPEQVRGRDVDHRSDIFSFGAILYELLTGQHAFTGDSAVETMNAILKEDPPELTRADATFPPALDRIVRRCLEKNPDERFQSARDLAFALEALSGSQVSSGAIPAMPAVRPTRRWPWAVAALFVTIVGGGAWWTVRQRNPAPSSADARMPARPSVAVLAFDVVSGGPDIAWLGKGLPLLLVTGLAQTPDIEVIGNERLNDAARQIGATLESVDRSRGGELARRAGARFVVNGTIVQAGPDLRIDARVEDLTTGSIKLAESVRGVDALALADDLAARVRSGLNVQVASQSVRKVADVASSSVDAYRAFAIGFEALSNNRIGDARKQLEEAVRLDPSFGLAYFYLSTAAYRGGQPEEGRRLLGIAATHLDRMSERDAMMVRAQVAQDAGKADEARQLSETLVARYPDTESAWLGLSSMQKTAAAREAIIARGVAALPFSPSLQNAYGYALIATDHFDEAIRAFQTYVKLRPSEPNALDSLAEGYLVTGDLANALDRYEAAVKGGYSGAPFGKAWALAVAGRYPEALATLPDRAHHYRSYVLSRVGRYREAERDLQASRQVAVQNHFSAMAGVLDLVQAMYALERRDCASVTRLVASVEKTWPSSPPAGEPNGVPTVADLLAGACAAREGRVTEAKQRLAHARSTRREDSSPDRWWTGALDGEIALAERDYERASRTFAAGEPNRKMMFNRGGGLATPFSFLANNLVLRDARARVAVAQGKLDEAIALYRGLLIPGPQQKWTAMLDPLHVLALARVLDKAGQRDAARVEYERFLNYWKDADKDLPELAEARAALQVRPR